MLVTALCFKKNMNKRIAVWFQFYISEDSTFNFVANTEIMHNSWFENNNNFLHPRVSSPKLFFSSPTVIPKLFLSSPNTSPTTSQRHPRNIADNISDFSSPDNRHPQKNSSPEFHISSPDFIARIPYLIAKIHRQNSISHRQLTSPEFLR